MYMDQLDCLKHVRSLAPSVARKPVANRAIDMYIYIYI